MSTAVREEKIMTDHQFNSMVKMIYKIAKLSETAPNPIERLEKELICLLPEKERVELAKEEEETQ